MAVGSYQNLPAALVPAIQQNFLAPWVEEGLDTEFAYRAICEDGIINAGIGETLTQSRKGRKDPSAALTPLTPANINANIDNGFSANYGGYALEQWTFTVQPFGDSEDINLMQSSTMILDDFESKARNNGVQAATVIERLSRNALFQSYLGGNTYVRSDDGTNSDVKIIVDDITGFEDALVQGVLTPVSGSNTLAATLTKFADGSTVAVTITGATADATNVSERKALGGVSGYLTVTALAGSYTPAAGDVLIASTAPAMFRPAGVLSTPGLVSTSLMTMQLLIAMKTRLALNGVPRLADGTYLFVSDDAVMQQLYADQQFQLLYQGRHDSDVIKNGFVIKDLLGITFATTTESVPEQSSSATGSGAVGTNAEILKGVSGGVVRRGILLGAGAIRKGNYEMLTKYLAMQSPNHYIDVVDYIAQIVRGPIDRYAQLSTLSWFWGGAFATPSDATATTAIIPTASAALYKRAAICEVASSS